MYASFNRFEIVMTKKQALAASHRGQCDDDVEELLNNRRYYSMISKIDPALIADELKGYGAWNEIELADYNANLRRITWIAAGNIEEKNDR